MGLRLELLVQTVKLAAVGVEALAAKTAQRLWLAELVVQVDNRAQAAAAVEHLRTDSVLEQAVPVAQV